MFNFKTTKTFLGTAVENPEGKKKLKNCEV